MSDPMVPEAMAYAIFRAAINERRCAELLTCLFDGGSATVDSDGQLVLATSDDLAAMLEDER